MKTAEDRARGSRTEGNFVPLTTSARNGAPFATVRTFLQLEDRCDDCVWEKTCGLDRTCWKREKEITVEVRRYRRRERAGTLTGTEADVGPVSQATGRAHAVGSGENAHEWIDAIQQLVDDADRPIEIRVPEALDEANLRLLTTLGVTVYVDQNAPSIETQRRQLGLAAARDAFDVDRGRDLLDRMDAGESVADPEPEPESATARRLRDAEERRRTELVEEEGVAPHRGVVDAASSSSTSSRKGKRGGSRPKWTRESAIAAIQAWAREHGRPPSGADVKGNRALPSSPTSAKLGGWAALVEAAGFPRPTRGTRYKDSSGGSRPAVAPEETAAAAPDEPEPERSPAPAPLAEVAQLEEHRPTLAGDAGSTPALRSDETPPPTGRADRAPAGCARRPRRAPRARRRRAARGVA